MNSIRKFVEHLTSFPSIMELVDEEWSGIFEMDSKLLEDGFIFLKDFSESPFFTNGINELSWVIIFQNKPYLISGFYIKGALMRSRVVIRLREIKIGKKLPFTLSNSEYEMMRDLLDVGRSFRLANCPQKTFEWLKENEATQEIIDQISQPA